MTGSKSQHEVEKASPIGELSYTEASAELDRIVEFFEQRDVDVDQMVGRLERATAIVENLDQRIRHTRTQIEELVPRLQGAAEAQSTVDQADRDRPRAGERPVDQTSTRLESDAAPDGGANAQTSRSGAADPPNHTDSEQTGSAIPGDNALF